MRVVLQRVNTAQVTVEGQVIGKIDRGLVLLVGIARGDTDEELDWMARKCLDLRVFPDAPNGRFDRSVQEIRGALLVVSQFTLYADCEKGRRPDFDRAATSELAKQLYDRFVEKLRSSGLVVETGKFGAMMQVSLENDGPVTLILERACGGDRQG